MVAKPRRRGAQRRPASSVASRNRAARVLGAPTLPSTLADRDDGARAQARWARGYGRMWARDVVRRVREGGLAGLK